MRPPSRSQSALRAPLNEALGTEANVRILRLLSTTSVPLSKAAVARRASLNASGVGRTIVDLVDLGLVESLGSGSRHLYRLRTDHPMAAPLAALFAAESARFESIVDGLRAAAQTLAPPPRAAWIQGPVATGADRPGDPLSVGILAPAGAVDATVEDFRAATAELERAHDVTISIHGLTAADFAALSDDRKAALEHTVSLIGPGPLELLSEKRSTRGGTAARTHADLDRQALALAGAIADKLAQDPSLVERARRAVERRLERASARERRELQEWAHILDTMSIARLRRFLVDTAERATRLRQTLPFAGALSPHERAAIRSRDHDAG